MFSEFKYPGRRENNTKKEPTVQKHRGIAVKGLEFAEKQGKSEILTEWFEAQGKKPSKHHGTTRSRSH